MIQRWHIFSDPALFKV